MNQKHMMVIGALAICGSLLVAVPSSFAAKSMSDKDMDQTTAAGQPRIDIGNGQQTIEDSSLYTVTIGGTAQSGLSGDSIVNAAGENNVAVGVNVVNVDGGGSVDQLNDIEQQRNSKVTITTLSWADAVTVLSADGSTSAGGITVAGITASADHIKIGHGDQTEVDNSTYTVELTDSAQSEAVGLSVANVAGRNNVAVALNAANRDYSAWGGITVGAFTSSQINTIVQGN